MFNKCVELLTKCSESVLAYSEKEVAYNKLLYMSGLEYIELKIAFIQMLTAGAGAKAA
jgi:hypothetical protein